MVARKSIKLSDYVEYPFLIPTIYLDFNISQDYVVVKSVMIIQPKSEESSKLILQGKQIKLLSLSIDGKELRSGEYILSDHDLIINSPPKYEFELEIKSKIDPFKYIIRRLIFKLWNVNYTMRG